MTTEQGSFEKEALMNPAGAYRIIVSRIEKIISPDGVDLPELVGQSGTNYTVEQTTTSKKSGDNFDSKTITINTETESWTLSKGTGTDHESNTDSLGYSKDEGGENLELGLWNHGEYWRNREINVDVFGKFDELLRDLETSEVPSATVTS